MLRSPLFNPERIFCLICSFLNPEFRARKYSSFIGCNLEKKFSFLSIDNYIEKSFKEAK